MIPFLESVAAIAHVPDDAFEVGEDLVEVMVGHVEVAHVSVVILDEELTQVMEAAEERILGRLTVGWRNGH